MTDPTPSPAPGWDPPAVDRSPGTNRPEPSPADEALLHALARQGLIAILRARRPAPLVPVVLTLLEAGVRCVEITLPTPGALEALRELTGRRAGELPPGTLLGAGTVTDPGQVPRAAAAGARFTVGPVYEPAVVDASRAAGLGSLPGCLTPTEAYAAWRRGASAVKLFPAEALGPRAVRALTAPLPDIPLVPTGGIGLDALPRYLAAGALACGVGSPLLGDALDGGPLTELRGRAGRFARLATRARAEDAAG
ncbi:bifunctional 4-hydroxy-2-oxoglutarate aldolase/2-dehydro-3-deoxy-phosphogluconate aldolase [Streptomyces sp. SudanB182_2057]|uniref:bifunctional 4-hydroxy-2-oxoglutarate aldolase/2-dehydro-3-deoxy-phosphogluconate aldolase n=1 Tax=Streptomyces sp. SudanB182_2057 TaxID=3035281 RepID=UPI003F542D36